MYQPASWVEELRAEGIDVLGFFPESEAGQNFLSALKFQYISISLFFPGIGNLIFAWALGKKIDRIKGILTKAIEYERSIFSLFPTRNKIYDSINVDAIQHSNIKLRLAIVSLDDGKLYYTTEKAKLLEGHANAIKEEAISILGVVPESENVKWALVLSALASSAQPVIFEPISLYSTRGTRGSMRTYVDGDIREVLPLKAALELNAKRIISISAGPSETSPHLISARLKGKNPYGLPKVGFRGIELLLNEVERNDASAVESGCKQGVVHRNIRPTVDVHDGFTVDPGLIRINMAHGYMRAFDEMLQESGFGEFSIDKAMQLTDRIIEARRVCHELESCLLREAYQRKLKETRARLARERTEARRAAIEGREIPVQPGSDPMSSREARLAFKRELEQDVFAEKFGISQVCKKEEKKEEEVPPLNLPRGLSLIDQIRRLKLKVFVHVTERFRLFGTKSLPHAIWKDLQSKEKIYDWCEQWERHDSMTAIPGKPPWQAQPIRHFRGSQYNEFSGEWVEIVDVRVESSVDILPPKPSATLLAAFPR